MNIIPFYSEYERLHPWVGWIRRINWQDKLCEVLPETRLEDHISVYKFEKLCQGEFSDRMNKYLPFMIEKVKTWNVDQTGKKI